MGNSTGNLSDYWDVINRHDILAGGFIWDWVDQGLLEHDADGTPYWTYGGDYGPPGVPSSGNFNFNGVVFPDRSVQPAYWEVKRVYQYVDFGLSGDDEGVLEVRNNYDFLSLDGFELQWEFKEDGREISFGTIGNLGIAAGETATFQLWQTPPPKQAGSEYHLNVRVVSPKAHGQMPAGHAYAATQFEVNPSGHAEAGPAVVNGLLTVQDKGTELRVSGDGFSMAVSRESGLLSSLVLRGQELMLTPLTPNLWRAPIDNDYGNYMQDWAAEWREASRSRNLESVEVTADESGSRQIMASTTTQVSRWHAGQRFSRLMDRAKPTWPTALRKQKECPSCRVSA